MEKLIPTRAQQKNRKKNDFVSVEYTSHKKKIKPLDNNYQLNINNEKITPEEAKRRQEVEMKKLRWDIMKFGASGFSGARKNKAKASLVLQLGGKPVKSRKNENYKELMIKKSRERARMEKVRLKNLESGFKSSLIKIKSNRRERKRESGILDVYGKIEKNRK